MSKTNNDIEDLVLSEARVIGKIKAGCKLELLIGEHPQIDRSSGDWGDDNVSALWISKDGGAMCLLTLKEMDAISRLKNAGIIPFCK